MLFFRKAEISRIDVSTRAEGSLTVPGDLDVSGLLKGTRVESKGAVTIHARAEVAGALKCRSLLVEPGGRFKGPAAIGSVPSDMLKRYGPAWGFSK